MPTPLVGVTSCLKTRDDFHFHSVGDKYVDAVVAGAAAVPVLIPALGQRLDPDDLLARLDGLMVTGSPSNVDPTHYGGPPAREGNEADPARDATTLPLIRQALAQGVPLLCICRGLQELNVALGGSLHQHVQEVPGRFDHRSDKSKPLRERYGLAHPVRLTSGGTLQKLFDGAERIEVNSLHGQGIDRLADRLAVEAMAEDGTDRGGQRPRCQGLRARGPVAPRVGGAGESLVAPPVRRLRRSRARPCRRQDSARPHGGYRLIPTGAGGAGLRRRITYRGQTDDHQCRAARPPQRRRTARRRARDPGLCRARRERGSLGRRGAPLCRLRRRHRRPEHRPPPPQGHGGRGRAGRAVHPHGLPGDGLRILRPAGRAPERGGTLQGPGQDRVLHHRGRGGRERGQDRALGHWPLGHRRVHRRLSRPDHDDHGADRQGAALQEELRADAGRRVPRPLPDRASRRHGRRFAQGPVVPVQGRHRARARGRDHDRAGPGRGRLPHRARPSSWSSCAGSATSTASS